MDSVSYTHLCIHIAFHHFISFFDSTIGPINIVYCLFMMSLLTQISRRVPFAAGWEAAINSTKPLAEVRQVGTIHTYICIDI